ncbi:class I tRNA ligase family protein [Kitasatospora sp. NPDC059827]|uniref:class I tRNA ligase family protein n=1 Tax=Kitasatospora sp. NPDC059827 TaxID=3346964 RepID=UPI00365AD2B9
MRTNATPRHYLLVPPEPTPNGHLHLGHIAGPFLRVDALARFLRMRGDRPAIMTGTDAYEPWVAMKARVDGVDPGEVVAHYHEVMQADLAALRIGMDEFVNPAEEPWHGLFQREIDGSVARLDARGAVSTLIEKVPYEPTAGRFVVGPLLLGRCPDCGTEVASYFCEGCGAHFRPEEVVEPRPRLATDADWQWRQIATRFLRTAGLAELEPEFDRLDLAERYRSTVRALLGRGGATIRLSVPETWGMTLAGGEDGVPSSLFSYTGGFMFARLLGEIHRQRIGAEVNSFSPDSDVVTVTSLGCDNVVSALVCINAVALVHGDTRPYDRVLINEFYQLAGEKFSTSRRHAITASGVAKVRGLTPDAVRYHLALVNPETSQTSFEPKEFLDAVNHRLAGVLEDRIAAAWERLPAEPAALPAPVLAALDAHLDRLERALDGPTVRMAEAGAVLDSWIDRIDALPDADRTPDQGYWWLKGLALLGFPIMPDFAADLWRRLGGTGDPGFAAFPERPAPATVAYRRWFTPVTAADFAACLPETLS